MKHLIAAALCCLMLAGCGQHSTPVDTSEPAPTQEPVMLYAPESPIEAATGGAVLAYPMPVADGYRLMAWKDALLVLSGTDSTTITRLDEDSVAITATRQLKFRLEANDPSFQQTDLGLSYYDPTTREVVILDRHLDAIRTISAPLSMTGTPLLSQDGNLFYYCTMNTLRCWDWQAGSQRMLREFPQNGQKLLGIYREGEILHCQNPQLQKEMLISAKDGRILWEGAMGLHFQTLGDTLYAALPTGVHQQLLWGQDPAHMTLISPIGLENGQFLPHTGYLLTSGINSSHNTQVNLYHLQSGLRTSTLTFPGSVLPLAQDTPSGHIYLMAYDQGYGASTLYRWDPNGTPSGDNALYSSTPGGDLVACEAYAQKLGQRYGIQILLGQAAADQNPWDYHFIPETQPGTLWRQLEILEEGLSCYPSTLLQQTIAPFGSLTICLVREIQGLPDSGSVDIANGLQFLTDQGCVLALAAGPGSGRSFCHELFHVMETKLLSNSTAFDQWENLNPDTFQYAMSYTLTYHQENPAFYQGDGKAFVDRYSMTYPKEDRARIMERAMTPGNGHLFQAPILQAKLQALCLGIREAFGLTKAPETFLWEQYLEQPLAPNK